MSEKKPLRSALKKKSNATATSEGTEAAAMDNQSSSAVVPKRTSAAVSASAAAAAAADASTAAATAARDARIRAAAEEKATQLHAHRAASDQWASWVMRVQTLLLGPPSSPQPVTASSLTRAALILRPAELDEVVEERVAAKQCGWPMCENGLASGKAAAAGSSAAPLPSPAAAAITASGAHRALHLSLKTQRVYDVSQSAETCSAGCALKLEEYKRGLSDEPFYLRKMMQPRPAAAAAVGPAVANAPAPSAAAAPNQQQQHPPRAQSHPAESKEQPLDSQRDDRAITQLHIVEKDAGRTLPPASSSAVNAALAIEGYQPTTVAASIATAQKVSAPAAAPATNTRKHETQTEAVAAPPAADSAATPAAAASAPSHGVSFAPDTAAPAASAPSVAEPREYLEFVNLPAALVPAFTPGALLPVGSSVPPAELSRAEFEALSPDARMDYMAHVALREQAVLNANRQASREQQQLASVAAAEAAASPQDEKKIRRRKSAGKTAATATTGGAQADASSSSSASTVTAAAATSSFSIPGVPSASLEALAPSVPLVRASLSQPPSAASLALLADDPDAEPIISPEEMRASVASARAAAASGLMLSPFVGLVQAVMRWSNSRTQAWIASGRVAPSDAGSRSKVTAFLTLLTQHLPRVLSALQVRAVISRELSELASSFAFDGAVPSLSPAQWTLLSLAMLKAVGERLAREEAAGRLKGHQHSWAGVQRISALANQQAPAEIAQAQRAAVEAHTAATLAAAAPAVPSAPATAASSAPRVQKVAAASSATCAECMSTTSSALLAAIQTLLTSIGFSIEQMDSLYQTLADGGWMQPA